MLDPNFFDAETAKRFYALYEELDEAILSRLTARIAKMGYVSGSSKWEAEMLQEAGLLYEDIISEIAKRNKTSEAAVKAIFQDAAVESVEFDNAIYEQAGLKPTPVRLSPSMTQILEAGLRKTDGLINNLTMTTAITTQTAYISACNAAYMQISSGAISYTDAIRSAVRAAAGSGTTVLYPSGHRDQLDVAIRRAALTGVSQTCGKVALKNAETMGCDLMEITAHAGARPSHAEWQGRLVSLSGRRGYLSLDDIGYGSGPGFKGWNCRHDWFPFFEGISSRAYSDAQLADYKTDGRYEKQQTQRCMERTIRKTKRELAGYDAAMKSSDPETAAAIKQDFDRASVKLKRQEAAMREFCDKNKLLVDNSRTQAYYGAGTTQGFGRSTAQKAVWAKKNLQSAAKNDIIITDEQFGKKVGKHAVDFGLDASSQAGRDEFTDIIRFIHDNRDEVRLGRWRGYEKENVFFYCKGDDVVITKQDGTFISILKGGINNVRIQRAGKL